MFRYSVERIRVIAAFLVVAGCSQMETRNICDPASEAYRETVLLKAALQDSIAPCALPAATRPQPRLPCNPCRIFLTTTPTSGALGGFSGADAQCMADSNKPAGGDFKALLVGATGRLACSTANCGGGAGEHIDWVLKPNQAYARAGDGVGVGTTNGVGLLLTQTGAFSGTSLTAWHGLAADWTTATATHCLNWTDGTALEVGTLDNQGNNPFIAGATNTCVNTHRLICVEQ